MGRGHLPRQRLRRRARRRAGRRAHLQTQPRPRGAVTSAPATVRPPEGFDLHAHVVATVAERDPVGTARLWVAQGRGDGLRRLASAQADGDFRGRPGTELTVEMRSVDAVAREVCRLGPDAVVLEPAQLRDAVVDRLTALEGKQ